MIYLVLVFLFHLLEISTETALTGRIKFYSNFGILYDHRFVTEPAYHKKGKRSVKQINWGPSLGFQSHFLCTSAWT